VAEVALIINPEEAELCIPLLRNGREPVTHLLTYAAPVTKKMLHFNNLTYYTIPALPVGWKPPIWLTTELGIFAGRLYFDFDEYSDLRKYLGFRETGVKALDTIEDPMSPTELHEQGREAGEILDEQETNTSTQQVQSFTAKPLTFLQEWLAVRRKGQDFTHTPMGYVCQGKPLTENHPFFTPPERNTAPRTNNAAGAGIAQTEGENEGGRADDEATSDQDFCTDDGCSDEDEENGLFGGGEKSDEDGLVGDHGTESDGAKGSPALPPLSKISVPLL
jgi:hypothetical protein